MNTATKFDLCVIGGGVIGLSIAAEHARQGHRVVVVDDPTKSPSASWAAAGILPVTHRGSAVDPLDRLRALSTELHDQWSERLKVETGIDNELRQVGTLFVARTAGEAAALSGMKTQLVEEQIEFEDCSAKRLDELFPNLSIPLSAQKLAGATFLPGERSIRVTRHLAALRSAIARRGGEIRPSRSLGELKKDGQSIVAFDDGVETIFARQFVVAAGAWSQHLLSSIDHEISVTPVRGQIALFKLPKAPFRPILYEGSQYLVPRLDGHVVAGATLEEVGYDNATTAEAIDRLIGFAHSWEPRLDPSTLVRTWAALRPGTYDTMPYIGALANWNNLLVATGHFRSGIHLSTGTAVVVSELLTGKQPSIDLDRFNPNRG